MVIENGSELDAINANLINKALCRTLFGRLFTFVVNRLNESLKVRNYASSIFFHGSSYYLRVRGRNALSVRASTTQQQQRKEMENDDVCLQRSNNMMLIVQTLDIISELMMFFGCLGS